MTEAELHEIAARSNAATPGPWTAEYSESGGGGVWSIEAKGKPFTAVMGTGSLHAAWDVATIKANQQFISHARADIPALCAEVERLRSTLEDCLDILQSYGLDGKSAGRVEMALRRALERQED